MKTAAFSEKELVGLLSKPSEDELNYRGERPPMSRLDALRELKRLEELGKIPRPEANYGVNTHIHTSESFSVFRSPAEAAWEGYRAGLEVLGINDHYTIAGHKEFREACRILGLKATFSIETIAMSEDAKSEGVRYNDPDNPGRIYLCGKGVVRDLNPGSQGEKDLATMTAALRKRSEEITRKVDSLLKETDPSLRLSFEDIVRLTPRGIVTERHVSQGLEELIERTFPDDARRRQFLRELIGDFEDKDLSKGGRFQDLLRRKLLKAGGPAYVEELPDAFTGLERMVSLFRKYGAIPTYPVLGNPVTERERDLESLFDELERNGIFAVEVIPHRNTRERLQEILTVADHRGFPVYSGTEHNTKIAMPLLDALSADPDFFFLFRRGAELLLGHQFLSKYAGMGYLNPEGRLSIEDREIAMSFFCFAGRMSWSEVTLERFEALGHEKVLKFICDLYSKLKNRSIDQWLKP